jgi:hypothetical protein
MLTAWFLFPCLPEELGFHFLMWHLMPRYGRINSIFLAFVSIFYDPTKGIRKELEIFSQQREQSIARKCRKISTDITAQARFAPSIDACVIMSVAVAMAHTKERIVFYSAWTKNHWNQVNAAPYSKRLLRLKTKPDPGIVWTEIWAINLHIPQPLSRAHKGFTV